ncbi:MAG: cation:proton antiporter [Rhodospirillaceae bacterium]|nr:cation:proton antiporter [Rhodospirillaceae bacterium]
MRKRHVPALILLAAPLLLGASGHLPPLVRDIGVSLLTAGVLAVFFSWLRIPAIAAFLVAGVVVGPIGARVVTDQANIDTIAGLGLILLLFLIGLEIDLRKLLASGRTILLSGLLQFPLCVLFGWLAALGLTALGVGGGVLGGAGYAPLYVGFLLGSSSTLLVVKLFEESFTLDTAVGRVCLGLLIFQDVWSIVVIALQPNFADPNPAPILFNFLGIALLGVVAFTVAKYALPVGFRWIAKSPDLMLVGAVAWCFAVGFLGNNLDPLLGAVAGLEPVGLSVSMEMGALIAGAAIASLPYSTEVTSQVGTVKNFFVTLFFIGLGMHIPLPDGVEVLLLALLFSALAVLSRPLIFFPLLHATGLYRRHVMVSALSLAQVSEFSLVIAYVGFNLGHVSNAFVAAVIFAFVITALLTPLLFRKADAIHRRLVPLLDRLGFKAPPHVEEEGEKQYALALLGFHRVASSLLYEIAKRHPALLQDILVVDFNVNIHPKIAALGPTVRYGDFSKPETMLHTGVDRARVVVCTIPDDLLKGTTNRRIVRMLRNMNSEAAIIVNALEFEEAARLYEAGADYVYVPRVDNARLLEPAIIAALEGSLAAYRAKVEEAEGPWHERKEVFA